MPEPAAIALIIIYAVTFGFSIGYAIAEYKWR